MRQNHSILLRASIYILAVFSCCNANRPLSKIPSSYDNGSGISIVEITPEQTQNFAVVCKVWGYLKYYHPEIAKGKVNWDFALFDILNQIQLVKTKEERNQKLEDWIVKLGPFKQGPDLIMDSSSVKLHPDLDWIYDTSEYGRELSQQLVQIKFALRSDSNYYVSLVKNVGNPTFKNESSYEGFVYPDAGYRLLALFRYWNIIQYYYPYRNLISEDWGQILLQKIPQFLNCKSELEYKVSLLKLVAEIHDTHAVLFDNNATLRQYYGRYIVPVDLDFVQNQAVVVSYLDSTLGVNTGIQLGDVVLSINNQWIPDIVEKKIKETSASNYSTQLRIIGNQLLRSNDSTLQLRCLRVDSIFEITCKCYPVTQFQQEFDKDTCFEVIAPRIGYINLGKIRGVDLGNFMPDALKLEGLILDLRNYPSDFVVFSLGNYFMPQPTPFVTITNVIPTEPGLFCFKRVNSVGRNNSDYYKGELVILINENTQSSAEYHAMAFRQAPKAIVLGSTTAGADGNVSEVSLPGGIKTKFSGIGIYNPDKSETQRIGIIPDIICRRTLQGVRENRDEVLEQAILLIQADN